MIEKGIYMKIRRSLVVLFVISTFIIPKHFLLQFVYLGKDVGTLVDGRILDGGLQLLNLFFLLCSRVLHLTLNLLSALAQLIVIELLNLRIYSLNLLYKWLDELHVA